MAGLGAGGQFGIELTDFVFVLTTDAAVNTFMQAGSATLGVNISIAFGPIGRSAEAGGLLGTKGGAGVFAYSKTRGLYGGITLEGGFIVERPRANKKFYGRKVEAAEILTGRVVLPSEAGVLMDVLNREVFVDEAAEIASESRALDAQTTGVIAEGSDEQPRSDPVPVAEVPSESPAEERSAEERSAEMDAQTDEVVAPAELSAESPADERPAELAAQTNEVVTGGSGQQPQSDSPPAAVQTPATKQVVESAPQLPALSNFEDLDVAHESKVQGSLPGDDQGLTGERVAQRETQA
jgi:hypothetical protein